jgi:hypothetical protein
MLVVLLLAVAAPVPQVTVYRDCRFTIDSTEYCPLLVAVGEYNPYCCAKRATPGPDEVPVLGVDCFDMFRGATPCPVVVTAGPAAWCCGDGDEVPESVDHGNDETWLLKDEDFDY